MKKIKVLFISHSDPGKGGAPKSLMELIFNLKNSFDVYPIVCVHSKDAVYEFCRNNGIECYVTKHQDIWTGGVKSINSWLTIPSYRRKLLLSDRKALELLSKKININSIDIIHSNVSVVGLGMYINKITGIPHIMHLREDADVLNKMVYAVNPIRNMNKYVDKFIAISHFVKDKWEDKGLNSKKIDLVYNGLQLPSKKERIILNKKKIKIVVIGTIVRSKGQLLVVNAINKLEKHYRDRISLDIIGTGNKRYINKINKTIKKYNLNNIHLLGYQKNINAKLKDYDIGIMASSGEAFGRVTVEYMANGLVVIANNTGADPEIVSDDQTGLLFDKNNAKSLAQKIKYLIDNPQRANLLSNSGQKMVYDKFTTNINAQNIYNEYVRLLNK